MIAIVKSGAAAEGVLMRPDAIATAGVLRRRDAATPARLPRTVAPNSRRVIVVKSRFGVSPPCFSMYSSSVIMIAMPQAANLAARCLAPVVDYVLSTPVDAG